MRRSLTALFVCLGLTHAFAQARAGVSPATVTRTPDGTSDLQGTWSKRR